MATDPQIQSLVARCLSGDHAAWSAIIDRYAGLVYAIARAHNLDASACDDIAQDVFAQLWKSLTDIRDPDALPGWISTTAKRQCWKAARVSKRESAAQHPEPAAQPSDEVLARLEAAAQVRTALDELGGQCEKLLRALFFTHRDVEYTSVAEFLGIPIGSIGPTRQRCLAKLARLIDPNAD